jgi:type I restriction enzyme, S subunit
MKGSYLHPSSLILHTFLERFDQFAEAPNAVQKMRELVLTLAVQGYLVAQDPTDEPAKELLARIVDIKKQLVEQGTIKRVSLEPDPEPHASKPLPTGWLWTRLGNVFDVRDGTHDTPKYTTEGFPLITSKNIYSGKLSFDGINLISEKDHRQISERSHVDRGDILLAMIGSIGNPVIVDTDREFSIKNVALFKYYTPAAAEPRFLLHYLNLVSDEMRAKAAGGVQSFVSLGFLINYLFPLPPLAEQKRIVAKVDELMALCDLLEAQQQERETRHTALARASLARFADAPTQANLNLLFHSSFSIHPSDLRKSILTLAVQGKLVPQNPKDESAWDSLASSGVDIERWNASQDQCRYEVPQTWAWIRFAGVGEQRLGKMLDAAKNKGELKPYLRNTNVQWMRFDLDDVKEMRIEEREEIELRLKKGDLLICEGGEPGRCAIWDDEVPEIYFQKAVHRVRPCAAILPQLLALHLQTDCQNNVLAAYFTGATIKHLTGRSLEKYPVPIPPLAEQRRIVAKVDKLMALVDQLETQLTASRATAEKLMEALVAELTAPEKMPKVNTETASRPDHGSNGKLVKKLRALPV